MWLDERDLGLLIALYRNGRTSNKALAREVGLSPSACRMRIRALTQTGCIARFCAEPAFARLGAFEAWLDVALCEDCIGAAGALERLARTEPEIAAIHILAQPGQARLWAVATDFDACQNLAQRLQTHTDLVRAIRIAPIHKTSAGGNAFPGAVLNRLARRWRMDEVER